MRQLIRLDYTYSLLIDLYLHLVNIYNKNQEYAFISEYYYSHIIIKLCFSDYIWDNLPAKMFHLIWAGIFDLKTKSLTEYKLKGFKKY